MPPRAIFGFYHALPFTGGRSLVSACPAGAGVSLY